MELKASEVLEMYAREAESAPAIMVLVADSRDDGSVVDMRDRRLAMSSSSTCTNGLYLLLFCVVLPFDTEASPS